MPEFQRVAAPIYSPTQCISCSTHADPEGFVDLLAEQLPPYGRVYLCAGCVKQAGKQIGMLEEKQANHLRVRLTDAVQEIAVLNTKLEEERQNKFVTMSDVIASLQAGQ